MPRCCVFWCRHTFSSLLFLLFLILWLLMLLLERLLNFVFHCVWRASLNPPRAHSRAQAASCTKVQHFDSAYQPDECMAERAVFAFMCGWCVDDSLCPDPRYKFCHVHAGLFRIIRQKHIPICLPYMNSFVRNILHANAFVIFIDFGVAVEPFLVFAPVEYSGKAQMLHHPVAFFRIFYIHCFTAHCFCGEI